MKSCIPTMICCLLLGAAINVGVAWTLAVTVRTELPGGWEGLGWRASESGSPYRGWINMSLAGFGSSRVVTSLYSNDVWGTIFPPVLSKPEEIVPVWAKDLHQVPFGYSPVDYHIIERMHDARGWPNLALWSSYDGSCDPQNQWRVLDNVYGIKIDHSDLLSNREISHQRFLPLRPIWSGFIINTLFYGALVWLVVLGSFVLRRFLRSKRGLCKKCAYPLGTSSVCSECGANVACET